MRGGSFGCNVGFVGPSPSLLSDVGEAHSYGNRHYYLRDSEAAHLCSGRWHGVTGRIKTRHSGLCEEKSFFGIKGASTITSALVQPEGLGVSRGAVDCRPMFYVWHNRICARFCNYAKSVHGVWQGSA